MSDDPTVGDLVKADILTDDDVRAAVDAYMADPSTSLFGLGESYELDLTGALKSNRWVSQVMADVSSTEELRRAAARTAIWLARPEKRRAG
ncbi:hypothetical protein [Methylobacterium durans]|uniref:Uncharacterized protein n=1 Tax=Methylobacterium durans TaxID=2202825 RepID=A0A2U8WCM9_9HYPH|nr:hypothetical protein [Methylobacterium durans]AWN43200.1 hypothetical protein DK389_25235 [Methylobacterium durans]